MKTPIADQIEAVRESVIYARDSRQSEQLDAAFATLRWVERNQEWLKRLAEFPVETVTVKEDFDHADGVDRQPSRKSPE